MKLCLSSRAEHCRWFVDAALKVAATPGRDPHGTAATRELEVDVWFDYVKSAANIADWPSRGQVEFAHEVNATRIKGERLKFPKLGDWGSVELALKWAGMPATSALHHGPPAKKRRLR